MNGSDIKKQNQFFNILIRRNLDDPFFDDDVRLKHIKIKKGNQQFSIMFLFLSFW